LASLPPGVPLLASSSPLPLPLTAFSFAPACTLGAHVSPRPPSLFSGVLLASANDHLELALERGGCGKNAGTESAGDGREQRGEVNRAAARENGKDRGCNGAGRLIGRCGLPISHRQQILLWQEYVR